MTTFRTTAAAIALAATATMGMTACGGSDSPKAKESSKASETSKAQPAPKAKDAFNKAQDAVAKYKSMEISASGKSAGKPANLSAKGELDGDPQSFDATMEGGKIQAVVTGGKNYVKGDSAYWKQVMGSEGSPQMASKMADKWLESPEKTTSKDNILKELVDELKDDNSASNKKLLSDKATVTEESVNGKNAWKITSEDKKTMAWVSQEASGDLLKIEGWEGKSSSTKDALTGMTFPSHDKDYGIKAPAGAKSVTDLMKG